MLHMEALMRGAENVIVQLIFFKDFLVGPRTFKHLCVQAELKKRMKGFTI